MHSLNRRAARRGAAFLALLATLLLLLQPICGAGARAEAAPRLAASPAHEGAAPHSPLHPVPGEASCCIAPSSGAIAGPPAPPDPPSVPMTPVLAGGAPLPAHASGLGARPPAASAAPPPPLPYHARTARILR